MNIQRFAKTGASNISRRGFLKVAAGTSAGLVLGMNLGTSTGRRLGADRMRACPGGRREIRQSVHGYAGHRWQHRHGQQLYADA